MSKKIALLLAPGFKKDGAMIILDILNRLDVDVVKIINKWWRVIIVL